MSSVTTPAPLSRYKLRTSEAYTGRSRRASGRRESSESTMAPTLAGASSPSLVTSTAGLRASMGS